MADRERRAASARDRFSGARIAAAVMGLGAGLGAAWLHLRAAPAPEGRDLTHLLLAAAGAGGWAGWSLLGLGLGRGALRAALRGAVAAAGAAAMFCLAASTRDMARSLGRDRYASVLDVADRWLGRLTDHAEALAASPALPAMAAAGLCIGLAAEALDRHWRWRPADLP